MEAEGQRKQRIKNLQSEEYEEDQRDAENKILRPVQASNYLFSEGKNCNLQKDINLLDKL